MTTFSTIPQPPTRRFMGNVGLLDQELPIRSFNLLAQQYGEIYKFSLPDGRFNLHVNNHALVHQCSDDKRFQKTLSSPLYEVRNLAGDGLFTAKNDEPNWAIAHRVLMPAFGPSNIVNMFEDMKDICDQMLMKWERFGKQHVFEPAEDFTRLTFDTIALCSMSYRFNSFYQLDMPKFTQEMANVLLESNYRAYRSAISKAIPLLYKSVTEKYYAEIADMTKTAQEIVAERRENPIEKKDLLTLMLNGKDPKTGKQLTDENISNNLLTFLIAGHETTSGLLTFATYYLLKNADALLKLREELDTVVGDGGVRLEHLSKLDYLTAVMRETLRLSPTAAARTVAPLEDVVLTGGDGNPENPENKRYQVKKGTVIVLHTNNMQCDPLVWGDDAESFKPERMLDGKFEKLPPQAWQPFGFGMRACIGRPFAWQEALLVLASVFHKFDVFFAEPGYTLKIKQALTIKPKDFKIRVVTRPGRAGIPRTMGVNSASSSPRVALKPLLNGSAKHGRIGNNPLYVFYGSNTGTSESFAQRIASDAQAHGFQAKLDVLDAATGNVPKDGPIIIVTASFEGEPADNAARFVGWLKDLPETDKSLSGVKYSVFGCGNKEWARTYQKIPTLIDNCLRDHGAERILDRGAGDASVATFFQVFDEYEVKMWDVLDKFSGGAEKGDLATFSGLTVEVIDTGTSRAKLLRQPNAAMGKVVENRLLTKPGAPAKRHIEFALPDTMTYRAGDYLAILPSNPPESVHRVLARFGLSPEEEVVMKSDCPTTFPVNTPTSIQQLLSGYVELGQPATTRDLQVLEANSHVESTATSISKLRNNYTEEVLKKRLSVLDILEDHPDIDVPLGTLLSLLPPMRIRQYSISSSPLNDAHHATLTVSVINAEAFSKRDRTFLGVASNFLANLKAGDLVPLAIRPSNAAFHLPIDPVVPVVMFCAGSGLAPFRGFVQERAALKEAGRDVGKTVLFVGCRSPDEDYLYADSDMRDWTEKDVLDIRAAFSRKSEVTEGCKYVQDRIWHEKDLIREMYHQNAKFYTCGSRKVANGIKDACIKIIKVVNPQYSDEQALADFDKIQKERYATDVFD